MRFKKVLGFTLAGAMMASSLVIASAEYNPNKVVQGPVTTMSIDVNEKPQDSYNGFHFVLVVDGKGLNPQENKVYIKNDAIMIPLRIISEALGYKIQWNDEARTVELSNGPHWIIVKPGEDYYSFGKMAPVTLGTPAEISEDRTYVPLNFLTDILKVEAAMDETGVISITSEKPAAKQDALLETQGEIVEINKTEKGTMLGIKGQKIDEGYDSIILHITDETPLVNPITDESITVEDLKQGDFVRAFYGPAVTRSIPPQGKAEKIEVLKGVTVRTGTITDIISSEKTNQILIGDRVNGIILTITDETKIVTKDNKELEFTALKKGMEIEAYHSLIQTMSLPPISSAEKIIVKVVNTPDSTEK